MPVHDWSTVPAGIFHDFHHTWITEIKRALNGGVLPDSYYALAEQKAGGLGPDVLTLQAPDYEDDTRDDLAGRPGANDGGLALKTAAFRTRFHARAEVDVYAAKANVIAVRHVSGDDVIAMIEIVSPGNRTSRRAVSDFIDKGEKMLRAGVHLLIVDLLPPGPFDPRGLPASLWDQFGSEDEFAFPADEKLSLAAFLAGRSEDLPMAEAFIEPTRVGATLPDMPLFLSPERYVPTPLDATYRAAWETMPRVWRQALGETPAK